MTLSCTSRRSVDVRRKGGFGLRKSTCGFDPTVLNEETGGEENPTKDQTLRDDLRGLWWRREKYP